MLQTTAASSTLECSQLHDAHEASAHACIDPIAVHNDTATSVATAPLANAAAPAVLPSYMLCHRTRDLTPADAHLAGTPIATGRFIDALPSHVGPLRTVRCKRACKEAVSFGCEFGDPCRVRVRLCSGDPAVYQRILDSVGGRMDESYIVDLRSEAERSRVHTGGESNGEDATSLSATAFPALTPVRAPSTDLLYD